MSKRDSFYDTEDVLEKFLKDNNQKFSDSSSDESDEEEKKKMIKITIIMPPMKKHKEKTLIKPMIHQDLNWKEK